MQIKDFILVKRGSLVQTQFNTALRRAAHAWYTIKLNDLKRQALCNDCSDKAEH